MAPSSEESDRRFVLKRERLTRSWTWFGSALLLALLGGAAWLWFNSPYLINPWITLAALEQEQLSMTTLTIMAAMLPLVVLSCLVLLIVLLLIPFAAFANERRLIRIIRRLGL